MRESPLRVGVSKILVVSAVTIIFLGATAVYLVALSSSPSSSGTSSTQIVSPTIASESISMTSTSANSTSQGASTSTSQSSSTISPAPCAQPYLVPPNNVTTLANGTQITESAKPAFVVGAGSTMALCVEFVDVANSNQSFSTPTELSTFSWPGPQGVLGEQPANNVSTTASTENISLSPGQTTVVEYKLSTGEDSTGFDGLFVGPVAAMACAAFPVAIGYLPSQVNSSDFSSNYDHSISCGAEGTLIGLVIGYTGASIAYLRSERTINLTENVTDVSVSSFPISGGQENITFRMHVQSFSFPVALGSPAIDSSVVRVFPGNPEVVTLANNYCSWIPDNQTAWSDQKITTLNEVPTGYLQFDSPTLQMSPYSSINYSFSILISGPIARYTAIDGVIIVGNIVVGASDFPVSIAGQLQMISGSCESLLS
jgi:hypothetical protein